MHYQTSKFGVQIMYKIILHKPISGVKYVNWFHGNPYFHFLSFSGLSPHSFLFLGTTQCTHV